MANFLTPSQPAAILGAGLGKRKFGDNGFDIANGAGADGLKANPGFAIPATFGNATPTEFGLQPNKSIPYHYSCKSNDERQFSPGALMFSIQRPRPYSNLPCPEGSRRVEDLIALNAWLATLGENHIKLQTAADVLREIKFVGVLKTKINESQRERQLGTFVLNNVVGGRASVVNVWGNQAREGTPLLIIVKKVRNEDGKWVWRFCPYASMQNDQPSMAHMTYRDTANGCSKLAKVIRIGTSMSTPTAFVDGNELLFDSKNADRLSCYSGGVDVCVGV